MAAISEPATIELESGDLRLGIVPEIGGSLAFLRYRGIDLMRPLSAEAAARRDVLGVASFPMTPYANRIAGNRFTYEGRTYEVQPNNGTERFNVHGSGWKSAWTAETLSSSSATLSLDRAAAGDPYAYRAVQRINLADDGLTLATTIENRGAVRMPFGFGHHPWFDRDADVELRFRATHFWLEAPEGIASDRITLPPELDFARGAPLPTSWRNNAYGGWDGVAEVRFPSRGLGLRIEADPIFGTLMFYADPERTFFCVEPQSNVPCAFNKLPDNGRDLGVIDLAPGETASGTIRFVPFEI